MTSSPDDLGAVKRYIHHGGEFVCVESQMGDWISASDHDSALASRDAEIARLREEVEKAIKVASAYASVARDHGDACIRAEQRAAAAEQRAEAAESKLREQTISRPSGVAELAEQFRNEVATIMNYLEDNVGDMTVFRTVQGVNALAEYGARQLLAAIKKFDASNGGER